MAITAINDNMFTEDAIADPYAYYGRLREEDPVHWNEKYALWVITRHDDVVWMTRHHELFSNAVFKNDPLPAYPDINESDLGLYEYVRNYLATPLPVLVIAQMMGVPKEDRQHVRHLAELLLNIGRGEADRMGPLVEGMQGMIDYVSPLVDERIVKPGDDFISVLADGEKRGIFTRHQVLVNTSLLLLAGHETTIILLCNVTLSFI